MTDPSPFHLDPETMRAMGHRIVDLLVDRFSNLDGEPAWQAGVRADLEARLRRAAPEAPGDFDAIIDELVREALPHGARVDHPRFMGFVPGSPTWPAVLGDFLAAGYNVFQGSWLGGSGASEIELIVLDWFKDWIGYPDGAAGLFLSGGSAANLTALACARQRRYPSHPPEAVVYLSSEAHSSAERAARVLGFAPDRIRRLQTDREFRLEPDRLRAAIATDRAEGLDPFFVIANGGATSTGAIDPLPQLAALCREEGLWLHVDAAYGGFAVLTDRGRAALDGLALADSITLDPHKWLFQPFEAGCLLVRNGTDLEAAFRVTPDYLQDAAVASGAARDRAVNFMDRGIQLTRSARALKVWVSLSYYGLDPYRVAIDRAIDLALHAEGRITASPVFETLSAASLGIVCFRRVARADGTPVGTDAERERLNAGLVQALSDSGLALISSTRLDGTYALRLCVLSHHTRRSDVDRVLDWLETADVD